MSRDIIDKARLYAGLGYGLSAVSLASPLDAAAEAVWRIVLHRGEASGGCCIDARIRGDGVAMSVSAPTIDVRIAAGSANPEELDAAFLAVAWELGAWDVARTEHMPLPDDADPVRHGITHHVYDPYIMPGVHESPRADADVARWIAACKRHGWMTWLCKPMFGAPEIRRKTWLSKDKTLLPDGSRPPRAWTAWDPVWIGANHQTVIRLGRANHGNRNRTHTR